MSVGRRLRDWIDRECERKLTGNQIIFQFTKIWAEFYSPVTCFCNQHEELNAAPYNRQFPPRRPPIRNMPTSKVLSWNELALRWRRLSKRFSPTGALVSYCLASKKIWMYQGREKLTFRCVCSLLWIVCARWPWTVLLLGISVATALTVGVIYLEVTIDPVELWAAPESRSRQEKDYFDKSFTPFYRTEQVILHAEGLEPVS